MLEMEKVGFNDINDGDGSSSNVVEVHICKNRRWVGKREYYIFFRFFYIWIFYIWYCLCYDWFFLLVYFLKMFLEICIIVSFYLIK